MIESGLQNISLFDISLDVLEYSEHEQFKLKISRVIEDITQKHPNLNVNHTLEIYQSINNLQNHVAFSEFSQSPQISLWSKAVRDRTNINKRFDIAFTNMDFLIIPPGGLTQSYIGDATWQGYYFVHSAPNSGFLNFEHIVDSKYFVNIQNKPENPYNSHFQMYNTPESAVYIFPGFLRNHFTVNMSNEPKVVIRFSISVVGL